MLRGTYGDRQLLVMMPFFQQLLSVRLHQQLSAQACRVVFLDQICDSSPIAHCHAMAAFPDLSLHAVESDPQGSHMTSQLTSRHPSVSKACIQEMLTRRSMPCRAERPAYPA